MLQKIVSKIKKSWDDWWEDFETLPLEQKMQLINMTKGEYP